MSYYSPPQQSPGFGRVRPSAPVVYEDAYYSSERDEPYMDPQGHEKTPAPQQVLQQVEQLQQPELAPPLYTQALQYEEQQRQQEQYQQHQRQQQQQQQPDCFSTCLAWFCCIMCCLAPN